MRRSVKIEHLLYPKAPKTLNPFTHMSPLNPELPSLERPYLKFENCPEAPNSEAPSPQGLSGV